MKRLSLSGFQLKYIALITIIYSPNYYGIRPYSIFF